MSKDQARRPQILPSPVKPEPKTVPWKTLCINLISPYSIVKDKVQSVKEKSTGKWSQKVIETAPVLHCLTMIDPATSWFEIAQINDKPSIETANELEITWLMFPIENICHS